jgi:hypothetical protein
MSQNYSFQNHTFVIEQYDKQKTFASFLPGLAGRRGIPLWAFYVNRGQGISSFGLRDKNGAIVEFYPANLAYLYNSKIGFRTFVKVNGKVIEFFQSETTPKTRQMLIRQSEFSIREVNMKAGIEISVTYYGLPGEDIAGLVRHVEVKSLKRTPIDIEILDGLSQILPSGIDYGGYKAISNLLRSWMDVANLEHKVAFYKLRSSTGDEAETKEVKDGNFYLSYVGDDLANPIVDMDLIYGADTAMNHAEPLGRLGVEAILKMPQYTANKVPCGFTGAKLTLMPGSTTTIDTLIGYASDITLINQKAQIMDAAYFAAKRSQAALEIDRLLDDVQMESAIPIFDEYIRQNYLDNFLRGGYPMEIHAGKKDFIYYLYSRKHGDLERDYNFFQLAPEFYSQGNGNFRDVCQNRRNDVLIRPETKAYSVQMFASLIQADGYNPLSINGSTFELVDKSLAPTLASALFGDHVQEMTALLQGKFTPGSVVNTMTKLKIATNLTDEALFNRIFEHAKQNIEANHGEGYWSDHWTYILDLVENYLHVYPDNQAQFLYQDGSYRFFESPVSVYPRNEKTVLDKAGNIRQYGSLRHPDKEKIARLKLVEHGTNWMKVDGKQLAETNLFGKLVVLALNKFALLDPLQLGIEMDGNKPGWNDAMNGLPGLFGSGMSETVELARLIRFLLSTLVPGNPLTLPAEFIAFATALQSVNAPAGFALWNQMAEIRENYREAIRFGTKQMVSVDAAKFQGLLETALDILDGAIDRSIILGGGIIPTFLTYEVTKYTPLLNPDGSPKITHYGLPAVQAEAFQVKPLPHFLEAPARYFKYAKDPAKFAAMALLIKKSGIYDDVLKQYKTSDDLNAWGYEIGRIRAFTKGWLEREANFLHMTYKYLLGLLKSGNVDLFFEEAKTNLVCFMDPEIYGRSTLENSSFIASSNNPNPLVHGQGFVSRLTGSTAEMLSIYTHLVFGKELYHVKDGKLSLLLQPLLTKEYFKDGRIRANFQGTTIEYVNASNRDGKDLSPVLYELFVGARKVASMEGTHLIGELALQARDHRFDTIRITLA